MERSPLERSRNLDAGKTSPSTNHHGQWEGAHSDVK